MTQTAPSREPTRAPARGPALPDVPGPGETARRAWRWLRRMSTAIWLLFALAAASVVATFVPQEPVIPTTVADWRAGVEGPGPEVSAVFDALGLYDVYGSTWFAVIVVLLFVSLTGCLIPRWRAFLRDARRPPPRGRGLARLRSSTTLRTDLDPEAALDAVEAGLAKRRYRRRRLAGPETASGLPQVAAERGRWREGGSLLFHASFYLLLVGIVVAQGFGFVGQVNVAEGQAFTDTRVSYDVADPGRFFELADHAGFALRLDEFELAFFEDGTPERFISEVTVLEDGEEVRTGERVAVNERLEHAGMHVYQMRFGMAPRLEVRAGDDALFANQVMLGQGEANTWTGVAKVSSADPQIALEILLVPDFALDDDGEPISAGPAPREPRLFANLWVGDLGLERPLPATQFDRDGGQRVDTVELGEGESAALLGGALEVAFPELTMWSGFQVAHQPGRGILLAAGVLVLVGLVPSLYAYRRRIWAEARPVPGGSEVTVAGVALQRVEAFDDAYAELVSEVTDALDAVERTPGESHEEEQQG